MAVFDIAWEQLSVGVAAVAGIVYVARVMRNIIRETLDRVSELQKDVLAFMGNHMSGLTKSLDEVSKNLVMLNEKVANLHEDNIAASRSLLESSSTIRDELTDFEERVVLRHKLLAKSLPAPSGPLLEQALEAAASPSTVPKRRRRKVAAAEPG